MPRPSRDSPHTTAFPCHPHRPRQRQRILNGRLCVWGTASVLTPFLPLLCLRLLEIRAFSHRCSSRSSSLSCKKRRVTFSFLSIGKPIVRPNGRSGSARAMSGVGRLDASCRCGVVCKVLLEHVLTRISP